MTTISSFINRLKKIGIEVELVGNFPWVYLDKVNGIKVKGTYLAEHGFTAFFIPVRAYRPTTITDITIVFNKIRETIAEEDSGKSDSCYCDEDQGGGYTYSDEHGSCDFCLNKDD